VEAITETPVAIIPLNAKLLLFNSHLLPSNKTKTKQKNSAIHINYALERVSIKELLTVIERE
jgi:hypothetical protein